MFFRTILRSRAGMTLVEMAIVAGLIGVAALGMAGLSRMLGDSSSAAEGLVARTQFVSALNAYLYSPLGCDDLKVAVPGGKYTIDPAPLQLTKWNYLGFPNIQGGYTASGEKLTRFQYFELELFDAYLSPLTDTTIVKTSLAGVPEDLKTAVVNIRATIKYQGDKSYKYLFNVPVLITDAGVIRFCSDDRQAAESCAAINGLFNSATGKCDIPGCLFKGNYSAVTCGTPPCDNSKFGAPTVNPYTASQTCPTGATAMATSSSTWSSTITCGKKCASTVQNNTMTWYTCMACTP